MKFGHLFEQRLQKDGFPPTWVDYAISYHRLKKCIHKLEKELATLGLDPITLGQLLRHVEDFNAREAADCDPPAEKLVEKPFEYILSTPEARKERAARDAAGSEEKRPDKVFRPKLVFTVDAATGEPLGVNLAPETKSKLHQLALQHGMSNVRVTEATESDEDPPRNSSTSSNETASNESHERVQTIEVPLTSDSEFFSMLTTQLSGIADLQSREEKRLYTVIDELSKSLQRTIDANPGKKRDIADVVIWRKILNEYVESNVFFETKSNNKVVGHTASQAEEQLQKFMHAIMGQKLAIKFKSKDSHTGVNMFLQINHDLLQTLKFQELNNTAMTKILKKFDKRTALGVKSTFPKNVQNSAFSHDMAKAVCYQVNKDVLETVPRLIDYTCPICSDIQWRPIKLECRHTFCIRCLIVMQEKGMDSCPLCRGNSVLKAYAANIDEDMMIYLKKWFPEEVKAKQKYNAHMAGVDQYGEAYNTRCTVM